MLYVQILYVRIPEVKRDTSTDSGPLYVNFRYILVDDSTFVSFHVSLYTFVSFRIVLRKCFVDILCRFMFIQIETTHVSVRVHDCNI